MYESDQKGYSVALGNSGTYCNYRAGRLMCPEQASCRRGIYWSIIDTFKNKNWKTVLTNTDFHTTFQPVVQMTLTQLTKQKEGVGLEGKQCFKICGKLMQNNSLSCIRYLFRMFHSVLFPVSEQNNEVVFKPVVPKQL